MQQSDQIIYFAQGWANERQRIGISQPDRRYHFYAIGRTGTGKSTLLFSKIVQDLNAGNGLALIDPHGDLALRALSFVPRRRQNDCVYINPADVDYPIGLNLLDNVSQDERHVVAAQLVSIFKKFWSDSWGPRMEHVLRNALLALLETPGTTLLALMRLLADASYRKRVVANVTDPVVRYFWLTEFASYPDRLLPEIVSPIQNKIGAYFASEPLRNMLSQKKSTVDFERLVNRQGILIANLAKGRIGEAAANLLGSFLVAKLQFTAMARAEIPENLRRDFYLYVDEFQNFTTESFADILAEARKYRLNLILAHQYLAQLSETVRDAVLANVGTLVIFRVGPHDAQILSKEFGEEWPATNLLNLSPYHVWYKMTQHNTVSRNHPGTTLPPPPLPPNVDDRIAQLIRLSRQRFARPRELVAANIEKFLRKGNHAEHIKETQKR